MPIEEAGALAALNAGLAEASSDPAPATTGDTDAPIAPETSDPSAAESVTTGGEAGDTGASASGDGAPAVDGADPAAADGAADPAKPAPADGEGEPAAKPDAAPVKAPDPLNDPLPNALKRETKERIQTLVGMVKEKDATLQTVQRDRDDLVGMIQETRATPEQYNQALSYLKMVNSPNRADRERALDFMQQEIAALARMLGKPVPGVNLLEGHQDLIDEVSIGRLSPERAQEIAASRARINYETRVGEVQTQQTNQQQEAAKQRAAGVGALNSLEAQLKAAEPEVYAAKRAVLVKTLKPILAQVHPSRWAQAFKHAYDNMPVPTVAKPPPPPPPVPQNTPLRASNPAGSARPEPKSPLEALNAGLAEAR